MRVDAPKLLTGVDLPPGWEVGRTTYYPNLEDLYYRRCNTSVRLKNTKRNRHNVGIIEVDTYQTGDNAQAYFKDRISQDDRDYCDSVTLVRWENRSADEVIVRTCDHALYWESDEKSLEYIARYDNTVVTLLINYIEDDNSLEEGYEIVRAVDLKLSMLK